MFNKWLAFNSSRHRLYEENERFAKSMKKNSLILDAGCGDAPYKDLFKHVRYESADFAQSNREYAEQITYVCDLKKIPVEDNRFDYVVCNQVLEHIPEPQKVIDELHRVLKPKGQIIFTAPLFYQEHEQPYDFFRYTKFGWRHLLSSVGFTIHRIDPMEGFFGLCGYLFELMYYNLPTKAHKIGGKTGKVAAPLLTIIRPFMALSAIFFHRLEKRVKLHIDIGAKNYVIIAEKA